MCKYCKENLYWDHQICGYCLTVVKKTKCTECSGPLLEGYKYCPFCLTKVKITSEELLSISALSNEISVKLTRWLDLSAFTVGTIAAIRAALLDSNIELPKQASGSSVRLDDTHSFLIVTNSLYKFLEVTLNRVEITARNGLAQEAYIGFSKLCRFASKLESLSGTCLSCGTKYCDCYECGDLICLRCSAGAESCDDCGKPICAECIQIPCNSCMKFKCPSEAIYASCQICNEDQCFDCIKYINCANCNLNFCNKCNLSEFVHCNVCESDICDSCSAGDIQNEKNCSNCGGAICASCRKESKQKSDSSLNLFCLECSEYEPRMEEYDPITGERSEKWISVVYEDVEPGYSYLDYSGDTHANEEFEYDEY